jgi:pyrimidine deaminase RibD-like protein
MGRHPHKEMRKAITEAEEADLTTGRNPEFGAKLVRKFTANHRDHEEQR